MMSKLFGLRPAARRQPTMIYTEPSLTNPVSQACTHAQMAEPAYDWWCTQIREGPTTHRKQWEFCYILQALARSGLIAPGLKGLGFGVGEEPLSALLASRGVSILATDLEPEQAIHQGWVATAQHACNKASLNDRGICGTEEFERLVDFRYLNMNSIAADIRGFDFCWSACALEHLGSIRNGLEFIENSLQCLRPGGVAVHTTELNCHSNEDTLDLDSTVLFRQRDFVALAKRLTKAGHEVTLNFELGQLPLDRHVDVPPDSNNNHLKLQLGKWVTTSFGVLIRKKEATWQGQ
jgi:2-polyprenyl-3-methyl-5-hydroxy-6-metoxy-1,4-benzoquinol methylase